MANGYARCPTLAYQLCTSQSLPPAEAWQQAIIGWLIQQVRGHAVDAVIIAGDIFDTGAPPSYARDLYNLLVVELHNTDTSLRILGGNHDSVATLGEKRPLLSYLSTNVIPAVEENLDHQVLVLNKRDGILEQTRDPKHTLDQLEVHAVGVELQPEERRHDGYFR